jgi:hypothetical protein
MDIEVERQTVEEGHGLRAASGRSSSMPPRCFLYQHQRDVLLPVQHSGRLQPIHRQLGSAGVDDGGGHRGHIGARQGTSPEARPRIIPDNGPQFIAKDFKEFIRISGMTHVRTSPIILNRTERSNAGTNRSRESASGRERRCRWTMHGVWWRATSSITTTSV